MIRAGPSDSSSPRTSSPPCPLVESGPRIAEVNMRPFRPTLRTPFLREILHHEIVGLSVGVAQLQHLRRVVGHAQRESELLGVVLRAQDVECRYDRSGFFFAVTSGGGDRFCVVGEWSRCESATDAAHSKGRMRRFCITSVWASAMMGGQGDSRLYARTSTYQFKDERSTPS